MGNLLGDFRYALRSLARQPTFARVAILTLVLGIGTNTAIFSVIKAVLLNQLPYQDAVAAGRAVREQNPDGSTDLVAPLTYLDWKAAVAVGAGDGGVPAAALRVRRRRRAARRAERARDRQPVHRAPRQRDARPHVLCRRKARPAPTASRSSAARSGSGISAASPARSAGRFSSTRSRTPLSA